MYDNLNKYLKNDFLNVTNNKKKDKKKIPICLLNYSDSAS